LKAANDRLIGLLLRVQARAPQRLRPLFDRHGIDPEDGIAELVEEIRLDGANSIASMFRGRRGVDYDVVVRDVARKLKLRPGNEDAEALLERQVLDAVMERYLQKASDEERAIIEDELREALRGAKRDASELGKILRRGAWAAGSLGALVNAVGEQAVAAVVKRIVLATAGRAAAGQAARQAAMVASYAIPLLNVVMVGWVLADIAGPAFRKTVPTVVEIALLRMEYAGRPSGAPAAG
jgi:uncharacterized protein YaaW (UPF0174 family)